MQPEVMKATPRGDDRIRATCSIKLWVLDRNTPESGDKWYGVVESIERTVYRYLSQPGEFVRYKNRYHPVHSVSEFDEILKMARREEIHFMNMELHGCGDALSLTESSAFIYISEAGPLAPIKI